MDDPRNRLRLFSLLMILTIIISINSFVYKILHPSHFPCVPGKVIICCVLFGQVPKTQRYSVDRDINQRKKANPNIGEDATLKNDFIIN